MPCLEWALELKFYLALSVNLFPGNRICPFQIGTSACRNWRLLSISRWQSNSRQTIISVNDPPFWGCNYPIARRPSIFMNACLQTRSRRWVTSRTSPLSHLAARCTQFWKLGCILRRDKGAFIFRCFARRERHVTVLIGAAIDLFTPKYSNEATGATVSSFTLNLFIVVFSQKRVIWDEFLRKYFIHFCEKWSPSPFWIINWMIIMTVCPWESRQKYVISCR